MFFIILIFICFGVVCWFKKNGKYLVDTTKKHNCIFYGFQGDGKDLSMAYCIHERDKKEKYHYSNIKYNDNTKIIALADCHAGENTYENLIHNKYKPFEPNFVEGKDIWLSDLGTLLPCQYNHILNKTYPSMPVRFALSRQLYDSRIHFNSQDLTRCWDKLREQQSAYVHCLGVVKFFPIFLIFKVRIYEDFLDAQNNLKPLKISIFSNKFEKALKRVENSARGDIKTLLIAFKRKDIKYNTRYFKDKLLLNSDNSLQNKP